MKPDETYLLNQPDNFAPTDGVSKGVVIGLLVFFGLLTCGLVIPLWNWTYWDFGDGNYMYIGRRMNEGLVPYRDILAPQPPLHLLLSAWSQQVGSFLMGSDLLGVRLYNLIVRLAGIYAVFWAARTWFRSDRHGLAAAFIYMLLPIGFWWSVCLQSENVEIVFLMIAFVGVFRMDKKSLLWAGIASGLALHINMTAVPYFLCNFVFLAARRPKLVGWYLLTTLPVWFGGAWLAYLWAGEQYLDNVLFNQVGSFPREEILGYSVWRYIFITKIWSQLKEVIGLEWFPIFIGLAALATRWRVTASKAWKAGRSRLEAKGENGKASWWTLFNEVNRDTEYRRFEYAAWYCIGMLLSICFTAKGGTVNYIFVLGEPAVAMLAADGIVRFLEFAKSRNPGERYALLPKANHQAFACVGCSFIVLLTLKSGINLFQTLGAQSDYFQRTVVLQVELPEREVYMVKDLIQHHTKVGDPILAPPFYAFATERTVAGEFAESFLWYIKYINEEYDRSVGLRTEPGGAQRKALELTGMIRNKEIPLIILDDRTTANVDILLPAIARHYDQLEENGQPMYVRTRHKNMPVFVPKQSE